MAHLCGSHSGHFVAMAKTVESAHSQAGNSAGGFCVATSFNTRLIVVSTSSSVRSSTCTNSCILPVIAGFGGRHSVRRSLHRDGNLDPALLAKHLSGLTGRSTGQCTRVTSVVRQAHRLSANVLSD